MIDLTDILSGATLLLSAWIVRAVHLMSVRMAVVVEQHEEHERRLLKLEKRAGL